MSNHTDLNVLLDGIEVRANFRGTHAECEAVFPRVIADNKVLVKALRRALSKIEYELPCWRHKLKGEITAILQASSEPNGERNE